MFLPVEFALVLMLIHLMYPTQAYYDKNVRTFCYVMEPDVDLELLPWRNVGLRHVTRWRGLVVMVVVEWGGGGMVT